MLSTYLLRKHSLLILLITFFAFPSIALAQFGIEQQGISEAQWSRGFHGFNMIAEGNDLERISVEQFRSSWWNARLAQRVMNSGSPEFQTRVADLIQDYVRARYMRDDIQIPTADQQRYKKTLEELSALDLKPDSNLGLVPASPVPVSPAPVKG